MSKSESRKYKSRKWLEKRYLSNRSTLLIPFFFVTLSVLVFIQRFDFFSIEKRVLSPILFSDDMADAVEWLVTGIYTFLLGGVILLYNLLRGRIDKRIQPSQEEDILPLDREPPIPRKEQRDNLVNFLDNTFRTPKYALMVGKSGSGKTTLVKDLEDYYKSFGVNIGCFGRDKYISLDELKKEKESFINYSKNANRNIMIFDQFERTLEKNEIFAFIIETLTSCKAMGISVAFVCMPEDLARIIERLQSALPEKTEQNQNCSSNGNSFEYETYFLQKSLGENTMILDSIKTKYNRRDGDKVIKFISGFLNTSDSISMIEINLLRMYIVKKCDNDTNGDEVFVKVDPMEEIKKWYFEGMLKKTKNPELAMIILYALSNCGYSGGLTLVDFQNLTFASPEDIESEIINIFEELNIIQKVPTGKENTSCLYVIAHDYWARYFESHYRKELSEQISTNIRDYCEVVNKSSNKIAKSNTDKPFLSPYYESAVGNQKEKKITASNLINFFMVLLGVFVVSLAFYNKIIGYGVRHFNGLELELTHSTHLFIILAAGCAAFYVYHYLQYFAKIFFCKKNIFSEKGEKINWNGLLSCLLCGMIIAVGITVVVLAMIFPPLWAAWISGGWCMIGILHLTLSKSQFLSDIQRKRLLGEGWLYFVVAFIIITLNILVLLLEGNMYPYYAIFIVFLLLTIRQHINADFMLAKVGIFVNASIKNNIKKEEKRKKGDSNNNNENSGGTLE